MRFGVDFVKCWACGVKRPVSQVVITSSDGEEVARCRNADVCNRLKESTLPASKVLFERRRTDGTA